MTRRARRFSLQSVYATRVDTTVALACGDCLCHVIHNQRVCSFPSTTNHLMSGTILLLWCLSLFDSCYRGSCRLDIDLPLPSRRRCRRSCVVALRGLVTVPSSHNDLTSFGISTEKRKFVDNNLKGLSLLSQCWRRLLWSRPVCVRILCKMKCWRHVDWRFSG